VRRQYAPSSYPPLHAPHGWHQDGALKFDFLSHPIGELPPNAMLNMVTCWISIDRCGAEAPGLELVTDGLGKLITPSELRAESVQARFTCDKFWRPILESGDALLFRGDILHRTHVAPEMTKDRTSIELRFFSAAGIAERLQLDRFIPLG
jgi:ectoine hydroxylase-related dioxygenase (phytanoyl-CoA dioxygenase family)